MLLRQFPTSDSYPIRWTDVRVVLGNVAKPLLWRDDCFAPCLVQPCRPPGEGRIGDDIVLT